MREVSQQAKYQLNRKLELELDGLPSTVMSLPAVTLTFDLLTHKSNHCVSRCRYIFLLIWLKLAPIVIKIFTFTRFSGSPPADPKI